MNTRSWFGLGGFLVLAVCLAGLNGCAAGGGGGGGGGEEEEVDEAGELKANFDDPAGGNFAVGTDADGNQYTFRAREEGGATIITEGNIYYPDGTTVKTSLDDQGRPVKFRSSTGENADLAYDGDAARIRYTSAAGNVEDVSGIDTTVAKARVQARRAWYEDKRRTAMQGTDEGNGDDGTSTNGDATTDGGDDVVIAPADGDESVPVRKLRDGLAGCEEVTESMFDETNADNPMKDTKLQDAAERIASIASQMGIDEVAREEIETEVDEVPAAIVALAGQTFILFEAEGYCIEETGAENKLTFDNFGVMLTEFDLNVVFPDISFGGADPGFIINYQSSTTVDLTKGQSEELGFAADVTPVFTGTQLDGAGNITIERRFEALVEFDVEFIGGLSAPAQSEYLFNAAFINGALDGDVLDVELILIDLKEETPVSEPVRARYYRQGTQPPERLFPCNAETSEDPNTGMSCPPSAEVGRAFEVGFVSREGDREYDYDWFVSSGYGYVNVPENDEFGSTVTVTPTAEGMLEVSLIVSDLSAEPEVFDIYTCQVQVGELEETAPEGVITCPVEMAVGEPDTLYAEDALYDGALYVDDVPQVYLYIFGTSDYWVVLDETDNTPNWAEITFWEAGLFQVAVEAYREDGTVDYFFCDIPVSAGHEEDLCADNDWYGDGICDYGCWEPDPDCDCTNTTSDGYCDENCFDVDPDCLEVTDWCAEYGWYGDGECDDFCLEFDPDCEAAGQDQCAVNGWYGDYECDTFCPLPDPDCEDTCALNGWYFDGECDTFCPLPDPDCEAQVECVTDEDCGSFGYCAEGICYYTGLLECEFDEDCASDEICVEGYCEAVDLESECEIDDDCGLDEMCVDGYCEPVDTYSECETDDDCGLDEMCYEGYCEPLM